MILIILMPCCVRCHLVAALRQGSFSFELRLMGLRLAGNKKSSKDASYGHKKRPKASEFLSGREAFLRSLPRVLEKLRLEKLKIVVVSSFPDPWDTLVAYNWASLVLTALDGMVSAEKELCSDLDFEAQRPRLEAELRASLTLGQTLLLAVAALRGRSKMLRAAEEG